MAVSTVKLNGDTLMTVNDTTATTDKVGDGEVFYAADGTRSIGSASAYPTLSDAFSVNANATVTRSITSSAEEVFQVVAYRGAASIISAWIVTQNGAMPFDNNSSALTLSVSSGTITVSSTVTSTCRVKVIRLA